MLTRHKYESISKFRRNHSSKFSFKIHQKGQGQWLVARYNRGAQNLSFVHCGAEVKFTSPLPLGVQFTGRSRRNSGEGERIARAPQLKLLSDGRATFWFLVCAWHSLSHSFSLSSHSLYGRDRRAAAAFEILLNQFLSVSQGVDDTTVRSFEFYVSSQNKSVLLWINIQTVNLLKLWITLLT